MEEANKALPAWSGLLPIPSSAAPPHQSYLIVPEMRSRSDGRRRDRGQNKGRVGHVAGSGEVGRVDGGGFENVQAEYACRENNISSKGRCYALLRLPRYDRYLATFL